MRVRLCVCNRSEARSRHLRLAILGNVRFRQTQRKAKKIITARAHLNYATASFDYAVTRLKVSAVFLCRLLVGMTTTTKKNSNCILHELHNYVDFWVLTGRYGGFRGFY